MNKNTISIYQSTIRKSFAFLKQTSQIDKLLAKQIPLPEGQGVLLPLCELHASDSLLIKDLSAWREANQAAYPTRFPVNAEGTAKWLRSRLLDTEDRILFLVLDKHGNRVGHLGFASCINETGMMEVDNVVRGIAGQAPGIMQAAMSTMLEWARTTIGPDGFLLRVFADNTHAVAFYERQGFHIQERIPLRRSVDGETESFTSIEPQDNTASDATFLKMIWEPSAFTGDEMVLTAGPSISEREVYYAWDAARNGWNSKWSGYLTAFEQSFANHIGVEHCLATSSCTGALHIALAALEIGPGDEVIVPDITWVATANAVRYVGATPVFADVENDSWCLDPESFEQKITPQTKAVIPVHLYGHPARMDRIMPIARKHSLYVIEDAAPAIGAEWQGQQTGTFGDFACFSFQGAKLLVTGEGGALVTSNQDLYAKALKVWDQGRNPTRDFWIDAHGLKYKMSNLQAAVGLAQVERCDEQIEMKRRLFDWYQEGLEGCPHLTMMPEIAGARSIYWMSNCRLANTASINREVLRAELKKRNIDTRSVFPAISQYPIWPTQQSPEPQALAVGNEGINLPSGVCLTRPQVDYVCKSIRELLS
jgi:perosamine synthetase